jgi:plastocyanin
VHGLLPRKFWLVTCSLGVLLLLIVQVNAAPALSVGSQADYSLSGTVQVNSACSVDQPLYWTLVCGYGASLGSATVSTMSGTNATVSWVDDGVCSFGSAACRFDPSSLTIPTGSFITWLHQGTLAHTVTANTTANVGLPDFYSGIVEPGSTYINYFGVPGNYSYYCSIHPWMKGMLNVVGSPVPVPPILPMPQNVVAYLYGDIGWNVKGLASTHVLLEVNHNISYALAPLPLISYAPLREQGSFPQIVNLTSRSESPSTIAGIASNVINSLANLYGAGWTHYNVSTITDSFLHQPDYTMWWANGPLSLGSQVPIMVGYGIVTGSESLNLGGTIGTRTAWIVSSGVSHSTTANGALGTYANGSISLANFWSFDQQGDLLLRSNTNASLTVPYTYRVIVYSYPEASLFPSSSLQPIWVTVTRTITTTLNVALRLADANLNLDSRLGGTADSTSPQSPQSISHSASLNVQSLPLAMMGGIGLIVVGAVSAFLSIRSANGKRTTNNG